MDAHKDAAAPAVPGLAVPDERPAAPGVGGPDVDTAAIRAGVHTLGHVAELCDALDAARAELDSIWAERNGRILELADQRDSARDIAAALEAELAETQANTEVTTASAVQAHGLVAWWQQEGAMYERRARRAEAALSRVEAICEAESLISQNVSRTTAAIRAAIAGDPPAAASDGIQESKKQPSGDPPAAPGHAFEPKVWDELACAVCQKERGTHTTPTHLPLSEVLELAADLAQRAATPPGSGM